jgi:hypothetical protein
MVVKNRRQNLPVIDTRWNRHPHHTSWYFATTNAAGGCQGDLE